MGLEEARQQIQEQFPSNSETPAPDTQETAPESPTVEAGAEKQPETPQEIADLAKLQKFLLDGKEYTVEELKKERMRLQDYTRKTQELAEERRKHQESAKYETNLPKDLEVLWEQPWRAEEFRKLYPSGFHHLADRIERLYKANPGQWSTSEAREDRGQTDQRDSQVDIEQLIERKVSERLKPLEEKEAREQEKLYLAEMDATETRLMQKYKFANKAEVYALAEYLSNGDENNPEGKELEAADWEKIFKDSHERQVAMIKQAQSENFNQQKAANQKLKDVASGGGVPGEAPVVPKNLKEAKDMFLKTLGGQP